MISPPPYKYMTQYPELMEYFIRDFVGVYVEILFLKLQIAAMGIIN